MVPLFELVLATGEPVPEALWEIHRVIAEEPTVYRGKLAGARFIRRGISPWVDL